MDKFSFFFAFYGLILGLAVTELLGGFAGMVRAKALKQLEPQTALLALFTFILICATWIDAWTTERSISLDFAGLWAPILTGTCYYLAAAVIFPRGAESYAGLGAYYAERKRFVVLMLVIAEALITYAFAAYYVDMYRTRPAVFWIWSVPYKFAILATFAAIWLARSRRANVICMAVGLILFAIPYAPYHLIQNTIARAYGYPLLPDGW